MEEAQKNMKRQFDKKRRNPQSRLEGWQPCVAGEQKYPVESTLKEAGQ